MASRNGVRLALLGGLLLAAAPAGAQQDVAAPGGAERLPAGNLAKTHGALRASELLGAAIYDDRGDSVGKVDDLLIEPDGRTRSAVVSVGGFLGLAGKDVEIPFDRLKLQPSRPVAMRIAAPPAAAAPGSSPGGTAGNPVATPPPTTPNSAQPAAPDRRYLSLVLPGATRDSLTALPSFRPGD